ncbi:Mbov_0121 family peptidase domain-containing ABC transporter [Mycoplasmopsis cricetuli]|uniref:Mbov_0121 family peptidase domain-containing ABC transporter n=1 Tax=Mycoplasmopsis cricetuli TaxID=171283 RepID=UPI00046F610C|nr:cysteine peptidase family C39 domain-containing protein [Mycoplasmopsis cricetuli]
MLKQIDSKDFSLIVLQYFIKNKLNKNTDINKLKLETTYLENGINLSELDRIANNYNLKINVYNCNIEELMKLNSSEFPLATIINQNNVQHMIVIKKIKNNTIIIIDPFQGIIKLSLKEFKEIFFNIVIGFEILSDLKIIEKQINKNLDFKKQENDQVKPLKLNKFFICRTLYFLILILELFIFISIPFINKFVLSEIIPNHLPIYIIFITITLLWTVLIFNNLKHLLNKIINHYISEIITSKKIIFLKNLKYTNFKQIQKLSSQEFLVRIFALDLVVMYQIVFYANVAINIIYFLASLFLLYKINLLLSIVLLIYCFILIANSFLFKKTNEVNYQKEINSSIEMNNQIETYYQYLQKFSHPEFASKLFDQLKTSIKNFNEATQKSKNTSSINFIFINSIELIGPFIILTVGAFEIWNNNMKIIDLIFFLTGSSILIRPIKEFLPLISFYNQYKNSKILIDFLNWDNLQNTNNIFLDSKINKIELSYVSYSHTSNINNKELNIQKLIIDQNIHLLGKNGSGKTTLCGVLSGNLQNQYGTIKINDVEINIFQNLKIKSKIIYVGPNINLENIQTNFLFSLNNLTDNFLNKISPNLKNQINKLFNGKYSHLSAGQKQILTFLICIFGDYDLFLFDEAFDNFNENLFLEIKNIMQEYLAKKLVIEISHNNRYIFDNTRKVYLEHNLMEI